MKHHCLLLEDDSSLGSSIKEWMDHESYKCTWAKTVKDFFEKLAIEKFDFYILDVGLPDGNGFDVADSLKTKGFDEPIIFLTAMSSAEHRLKAYKSGGTEFVPKPFLFEELKLRLEHVLENHSLPKQFEYKDLTLFLETRELRWKSGERSFLAQRDFGILLCLIESSPKIVTRDQLLDKFWGVDQFPTHRTVDNSIVRLRQALKEHSSCIDSVRGEGYRWFGE